MNSRSDGPPNSGRLRRKFREKLFVYSMLLMTAAFAYSFGYRPEWLYGTEPTVVALDNRPWMIDNIAHYTAGTGLAWIFIYRFRLSLESKMKWVLDIIVYSVILGGVFWEFAVERPIDVWIIPFFPGIEKLQKGVDDTGIDILMVCLGSMSGLVMWKFIWRPGYMLIFPNSAKEEYLDELEEHASYARSEAEDKEKKHRANRAEFLKATKKQFGKAVKKKMSRKK